MSRCSENTWLKSKYIESWRACTIICEDVFRSTITPIFVHVLLFRLIIRTFDQFKKCIHFNSLVVHYCFVLIFITEVNFLGPQEHAFSWRSYNNISTKCLVDLNIPIENFKYIFIQFHVMTHFSILLQIYWFLFQ